MEKIKIHNTQLIVYVWEYKKLKISTEGVDGIFCNLSLQNIPNKKEIENILNIIINKKKDLSPNLQNKIINEIKDQTDKKWNCICKNGWRLNNDVLKLIKSYSQDFHPDYIKNIKSELIDYSILLLNNIMSQNMFDLNWYDFSEPDYRWAQNTIIQANEEKKKIEKIRLSYINYN